MAARLLPVILVLVDLRREKQCWMCANGNWTRSSFDYQGTRRWPDVEILKRLRDAISRKRPHFWQSGDWLLHHDNAPAHSSNLVQQYLSKHGVAQLRQPPYSPDIAPCDFWLFPRLKMPLKGHRFDDKETVETNATHALKAIPKTDFQECCKKWKHRYERVVQSNGDYLEGCHHPDDEE